ncbi:MAG: flagellar hook-basal body complex protein FliE [Sphingopyxis sp.]
MNVNASQVMAMRSVILDQNSALQRAAGREVGAGAAAGNATGAAAPDGFGAAMRAAVDQVNNLSAQSEQASAAFERGEVTDIASVMLARQQASIGFEATLQVRNKLLSAYKDIMSMPV